jgi:hypothetical protein
MHRLAREVVFEMIVLRKNKFEFVVVFFFVGGQKIIRDDGNELLYFLYSILCGLPSLLLRHHFHYFLFC